MAKYANLKEEVEYNVLPMNSDLRIFIRDGLNKTNELSFDSSIIKKIKELKIFVLKVNSRFAKR